MHTVPVNLQADHGMWSTLQGKGQAAFCTSRSYCAGLSKGQISSFIICEQFRARLGVLGAWGGLGISSNCAVAASLLSSGNSLFLSLLQEILQSPATWPPPRITAREVSAHQLSPWSPLRCQEPENFLENFSAWKRLSLSLIKFYREIGRLKPYIDSLLLFIKIHMDNPQDESILFFNFNKQSTKPLASHQQGTSFSSSAY